MATSSETSDQNHVKSKRPAESAFKQQRLPAWQPILTAGTVLPTFFVIGIAFIPVGIGLLYFSDEVKEHVLDYTECNKVGDTITCADYIKQNDMSKSPKCMCELELNLTEDFKSEVFFYYGLSNYYQNHRRYVKSRDDSQLLGRLSLQPSSDCEPFGYDFDENGVKKPVAPCGAIANSLFNDTLTLYSQEQQVNVPVLRTGIAWNSDKEIKFRNPVGYSSLKDAFANFTKPANWVKHVWELDLENVDNNGFQNEDLIVWMRTAALPTFRKLYRRVDHTQTGFRTGLNKGPYTLRIEYNYPVTDFDGTKSFVISTTSLLGGKNPFLGVAYVVVGTLCLLLGIVLLIIHVRCSKRIPRLIESESTLMSRPAPEPQETGVPDAPSPYAHNSRQRKSRFTERTKKFFQIKRFSSKKNTVNAAVEAPRVSAAQYTDTPNLQAQKLLSNDKTTKETTALRPLTLGSDMTSQKKGELKTPDFEKFSKPDSSVTPPNQFNLASETKNSSGSVELKPVSLSNVDAGERTEGTIANHSDESILIKLPSTELSVRGGSGHSVTRSLSRQIIEHVSQTTLDNAHTTTPLKDSKQGVQKDSGQLRREDGMKHGSDKMVNGENVKNESYHEENRSLIPSEDVTLKGGSSESHKQRHASLGSRSSSRTRTTQPTREGSETGDERKKSET